MVKKLQALVSLCLVISVHFFPLFCMSYNVSAASSEAKQEPGFASYCGYLDESSFYSNQFTNCDYDMDFLTDRVYRELNDDTHEITYRIDFGDGSTLTFGPFEDYFTMLDISAVTADEHNTILLLKGIHSVSTWSYGPNEFSLYQKASDHIEAVSLPLYDQSSTGFSASGICYGANLLRLKFDALDYDQIVCLGNFSSYHLLDGTYGANIANGAYDMELNNNADGSWKLTLYQTIFNMPIYYPVAITMEYNRNDWCVSAIDLYALPEAIH